jgi:peroxiredoxin family protein
MDLLEIEHADLDPLVDGVEGVTAFWATAERGQVLFI